MSFETFKTCLDKIPKSVTILFSGYTEPFLNPECTKMILYAHNSGYTIQVYSTLVGMTLDDIEQFKHIPFKGFHVHLPDASMHAKIAVNQNYITILKKLVTGNVKNLTSMSMENCHPKIKEILENEVMIPEMVSRAGTVDIVKNDFKKILGPISCNRATFDRISNNVIDINVLLPNGDVALCCMDYGLQNILGNLLNSEYQELFESESYKTIYEKMQSYDSDIICRNCNEARPYEELNESKQLLNNYSNDKLGLSLIKIYNNLLHRSPDPDGFNFYYEKISKNELTISDVENAIKQSKEYQFNSPPNLILKDSSKVGFDK